MDGFDFEKQESTLKILAFAFGGDSACTDCNRVVRVPGFQNCKYDPAHVVTVQYLSDCTYSPEDFHLDISGSRSGDFYWRNRPSGSIRESTPIRNMIGLGFRMSLLKGKTP